MFRSQQRCPAEHAALDQQDKDEQGRGQSRISPMVGQAQAKQSARP